MSSWHFVGLVARSSGMNSWPIQITALDAAIALPLRAGRDWRGASEFWRSTK
jgi:hypothetical protein